MSLIWDEDAWEDYLWWQDNDRKTVAKINKLIKDIQRDPDNGIGKPERLRADLSGYTSRRITLEHRLVYRVAGSDLKIAQCRYHYTR